jgi:hypothetical protein
MMKKTNAKPETDRREIGYMCGVAWQHEVGNTKVELFANPKDCAKKMGCTDECGIVELELRLVKWVKKQKWVKKTSAGSSQEGKGAR